MDDIIDILRLLWYHLTADGGLNLIFEILGLTVGIFYLYWEYHASAKVWIASVIMPGISMWLYLSKGLYADFAINIYYLAIAVYGFIIWTRGSRKKGHDRPITRISIPTLCGCMAATGLLWWFIWFILTQFTDSTVPVADAFTTALSIVGLWMMARKYAEQWLAWIVVDIVCVALYFYKELPLYAVLYFIYTVVAVLGYRKWLTLMRESKSTASSSNLGDSAS